MELGNSWLDDFGDRHMGSSIPDWLKYLIVSAISLAGGVVLGGWFTVRERAQLENEAQLAIAQVTKVNSELTEKDASITKLTEQLEAVDSRIAKLNEQLDGFEDKLTEAESRVPLVLSFASIAAPPQPRIEQVAADPIEEKTPGAVTRTRCTAITLKGTQCKRKAKLGDNGKCWQHQE